MNIIFIIILVCVFNYIGYIQINRFNQNAIIDIINSNNTYEIKNSLTKLNPLVLKNTSTNYIKDVNLENLLNNNKGYILVDNDKFISFDIFSNENNISLYHNKKAIVDFNLSNKLDKINDILCTELSCNVNHYLDIFKGQHKTDLITQKNNVSIYNLLEGKCTFYLINPKYHNDIQDTNKIKKWSNKIELLAGAILYVPPNWKYSYESNNTMILSLTTSDKYNTFLYNLFK